MRIAKSFVEACIPQSGKPYVESLKNFVQAAVQAYRSGYSLQALQMEMASMSDGGRNFSFLPRPLREDEVELRSMWVSLVYKTARAAGEPSGDSTPSGSSLSFDAFDGFVKKIVAAVRAGSNFEKIKLEQALAGTGSDGPSRTPEEAAILLQSTRLVVLTMEFLSGQF